jgi:hypothetical protein
MPEQLPPGGQAAEPRLNIVQHPEYNITRTLPDELLRHDISDEELAMLCGSRRDGVREGMWAAVGTFGGALPAGAAGLVAYSVGKDAGKLALIDLVQVVILFVALALSLTLAIIVFAKRPGEKPLEEKIRERTKRVAEG